MASGTTSDGAASVLPHIPPTKPTVNVNTRNAQTHFLMMVYLLVNTTYHRPLSALVRTVKHVDVSLRRCVLLMHDPGPKQGHRGTEGHQLPPCTPCLSECFRFLDIIPENLPDKDDNFLSICPPGVGKSGPRPTRGALDCAADPSTV